MYTLYTYILHLFVLDASKIHTDIYLQCHQPD